MLITVGIGGGFGYTGQRVIVQDEPFTNVLSGYDAINQGRFFSESALEPYSLRLDEFEAHYELDVNSGQWHPTDFEAQVSTRESGGDWTPGTIRVNSPLTIGGTDVYLLGNGYAPVITVRDPDGTAVFSRAGAVPSAGRQSEKPRRREGPRRARPAARAAGLLLPRPGRRSTTAPTPRSRRPSTANRW